MVDIKLPIASSSSFRYHQNQMSDVPRKLTHQLILNPSQQQQQQQQNHAKHHHSQNASATTMTATTANNGVVNNTINSNSSSNNNYPVISSYHQQQMAQMRKALASASSTDLDASMATTSGLSSHHNGNLTSTMSNKSPSSTINQTMTSTTTSSTSPSASTNNTTADDFSLGELRDGEISNNSSSSSTSHAVMSSSTATSTNNNLKILPQPLVSALPPQGTRQQQVSRRLRSSNGVGSNELESLIIENVNSDDENRAGYGAKSSQQSSVNRRSLMEPLKMNQANTTNTSTGGTLRIYHHNGPATATTTNNTNAGLQSNTHGLNQSHHHHNHHHHHHHRQHEIALLKEVIQLGIKRERAEKALAAVGYTTSLDAISWMMAHSRDPLLGPNGDPVLSTRDFMLVLCPVGRMAAQIGTFFQQSRAKCGQNDAHYTNILPYMKLSPFFKIADSQVANLHRAFDLVFKQFNSLSSLDSLLEHVNMIKQGGKSPGAQRSPKINVNNGSSNNNNKEISIDLHVSSQMILLYPDIDSENLIKEAVSLFNKAVQKHTSTEIIPYSKQLHLTLAYNFEPDHKRALEELAIQHINYRMPAEWEIRLYSRDSRADSRLVI